MTSDTHEFDHDILVTDTTLTVWWLLPDDATPDRRFHVSLDGGEPVELALTHYTFEDLEPSSTHTVEVRYDADGSGRFVSLLTEHAVTAPVKQRLDVSLPPYNAVGDGATLNTAAIQRALDDCDAEHQVVIPKGVFLSGALRLHSNTELVIEHGGVLQGSSNPADYEPRIWSRFEGIEGERYSSLLNIGVLDHSSSYNCENIVIRGHGSILGGGVELMQSTIDQEMERLKDQLIALGDRIAEFEKPTTLAGRVRGRLINVSNGRNIVISGLTVGMGPAWNLHFVYSDHVTVSDCTFVSRAVWNGDGCDPDSSTNVAVFGCAFETGDDMVAIKSGRNPEGNVINRPTEHVRIFDCNSLFGWGIAIGSEMSGGVSDVEVWDCDMSRTAYGLEVKATKKRGGYVRGVRMRQCRTSRIMIHSVGYNDDGEGSDVPPVFENMEFRDVHFVDRFDPSTVSGGSIGDIDCDIDVQGFDVPGYEVRNVAFHNVGFTIAPDRKTSDEDHMSIRLRHTRNVVFDGIQS